MKAYNAEENRRDHETCRYGCCGSRKGRKVPVYLRRAKKAARRSGRKEIVNA